MRERVKPLVALISGVVCALIKTLTRPRVHMAPGMCSRSLQKGDQSEAGGRTQMLRCTVTNTHTCAHAHTKRQWWIRKRSDSLRVTDSPHLHNKLSHDLISLCSPLFSSLTSVFSSFNLNQPLSETQMFKRQAWVSIAPLLFAAFLLKTLVAEPPFFPCNVEKVLLFPYWGTRAPWK